MKIDNLLNNQPIALSKASEKQTAKQQDVCSGSTCENKTKVPCDCVISYHPNFVKTSPEKKFDYYFEHATEISDGSKLIKPTILSLGTIEISPTGEEKEYVVTRTPLMEHEKGSVKLMTEDEILNDKWLSRGTIKQLDDDKYAICCTDIKKKHQDLVLSKAECMQFLEENLLHL